MIIIHVGGQPSFEMSLVEDDDVIQKFSAQASDYALNMGVLPRRSRRGGNLVNCRAQKLYRRLLGCPLVDDFREFCVIEPCNVMHCGAD